MSMNAGFSAALTGDPANKWPLTKDITTSTATLANNKYNIEKHLLSSVFQKTL